MASDRRLLGVHICTLASRSPPDSLAAGNGTYCKELRAECDSFHLGNTIVSSTVSQPNFWRRLRLSRGKNGMAVDASGPMDTRKEGRAMMGDPLRCAHVRKP